MKGWQCPGCQKCYAPHVSECTYCQPVVCAPFVQIRPYQAQCTCGQSGTNTACPVHGYTITWTPPTTTTYLVNN